MLLLQVKERVKVEVGVEAVGGWGAVEGLEGGVLSLVEGCGDTVQIF